MFNPQRNDQDCRVRPADYAVNLVLSVILIVGVYQFYFWCQRNALAAPRELKLRLDDWIPYWPSWVWIYSCIYYPIILYLNFVIESQRHFTYVATSYVLLTTASARCPSGFSRWCSASTRAPTAFRACTCRSRC